MDKENFDFLIFRLVVTVRDIEFDRLHGHADSGPLKSVLLHLATYCSTPDGSRVFPGVELLVKKTGYSRRAVFYALEILVKEGWIQPETKQKGHTKGYKFAMDKLGITLDDTKVIRRKVVLPPPAPPTNPPPDEYPPYEDGLRELTDEEYEAETQRLKLKRELQKEGRERMRQKALEAFQVQ